ncbi:MAG TPA: hypothetical protein V6C65_39240 [Allocoleopsis sp.]
MDRTTTIFIIGIAAAIIILLLVIKNYRDRKNLIKPGMGEDAVEEEITIERDREDQV